MTYSKGFTLLEIMIVIVIIGLLGSMIIPSLVGRDDEARVKIAQTDLRSIASALDLFKLDNFRYPSNEEGLDALVNQPSNAPNWSAQGYLKKLPKDPWGKPYFYLKEGHGFDIYTFGADQKQGGENYESDIYYSEL